MHRYILHNGGIRNATDTVLSPGQVGFLNGWGVFSTLRVTNGVPFAFERHYARLLRDAERMHVPFSFKPDELRGLLLSLIEANGALNAVLRVAVVRNKGGLFEGPHPERASDLVALTANLTQWGPGVHLTYLPNARFGASPFAGTKVTSWIENLTWYETVHENGFDEAILLNENGEVSECTSANIFAIYGKDVWTPPLETSGCLPGVTRAILLEEVSVRGVRIGERPFTPSELEAADCVFITSTTRDLLPVFTVDGLALKQEDTTLRLLCNEFAARRSAYSEKALHSRMLIYS